MPSDLIPVRYRKRVYEVLAALYALELVFDVVPQGWQDKFVAGAAVFGFSLARFNTTPKP
jgi:hypothetical protein